VAPPLIEIDVALVIRGKPACRSDRSRRQPFSKEVFMDDDRAKAIAIRAYEIWESEGRQHGLSEIYWFRAESELGYGPDEAMMGNKPGSAGAQDPAGESDQLRTC
jgi:Protein of unknown function (DUF2934)